MTIAEAHYELNMIKTYVERIKERKRRLAELRHSLFSIKVSSYGSVSHLQASGNDQCRLERYIDLQQKLEDMISKDILAMAEAQQRLVERIEHLPAQYSDVLTRHYIHFDRFEKIAVDTHYSFRQVLRIHKKGLAMYAEEVGAND